MHTVFGVLNGLLIRTLCNGNALNTHGVTRSIHHDEHVLEASVFFAHQEANGTTVVTILQHRSRTGLDAHFVFNADAVNIVAISQTAICFDHELGHHKQADALHAFGRALNTGQHQVNYVVGHVVFTIGDVDFGAKHFVGAIGQGLCAGAHQSQIRTCLGLCQIHGASPLTRDELL